MWSEVFESTVNCVADKNSEPIVPRLLRDAIIELSLCRAHRDKEIGQCLCL